MSWLCEEASDSCDGFCIGKWLDTANFLCNNFFEALTELLLVAAAMLEYSS
jgi:hypothetical protein